MIEREQFKTSYEDGVVLKGILLKPENPKAIVQFNGGTATKKEFYLPFLLYLTEHGYLCCLWDYRGSGDSAPEDLRACGHQYRDYGLKDMPTIKTFLIERFPNLPILLFAHSVGGQQFGFMENLEGYKGMVGYGVSTGYMKNMPFSYRLLSYYFFYVFTPFSNFWFGYLKAKKFGIMEDLPKKVVLEWRDWCSKKSYFFDEKFANKTAPVQNYKAIPFPIHIFWAPDDPIANERNVKDFWANVSSKGGINFQQLHPKDMGIQKIEHFGFFKKRMKEKLWGLALDKLNHFLTRIIND